MPANDPQSEQERIFTSTGEAAVHSRRGAKRASGPFGFSHDVRERANTTRLFIIGCPRSGTTWVQLLLDQHPAVVTAPETQIFAYYLDHFRRQWNHEHEGPGRAFQGRAGLSRLLSEKEFEELCRTTANVVLAKIGSRNPKAEIVVEKSPKHALEADFIRRLFPSAYFLHVIRDPRDTAASLLAAGRSWGRGWAPKNAIGAARLWRYSVQAGRRVKGERYREIRYEELKRDASSSLQEVLAWLGISQSLDHCADAVEACSIAKLRKDADTDGRPVPSERSPEGFFRKGSAGGWREELSPGDVRVIEYICRGVMKHTGYNSSTRERSLPPLRIPLHDAIQRIRESIDWQIQRLAERI